MLEVFALDDEIKRIETKEEVSAYLARLKYALNHGAKIDFQIIRQVDAGRPVIYSNRFTIADLFPHEDPLMVLKRELLSLSVAEYISTNRDINYPNRSEMRVFGKVYEGTKEVYIKIRVVLLGAIEHSPVFVMSFHYTTTPFKREMFPYKD
ncbi:MAG: hypothetical protein J6023_05885 [Clostridia bacterium]|nr:hypothetical protein [Clostridia bacterium]